MAISSVAILVNKDDCVSSMDGDTITSVVVSGDHSTAQLMFTDPEAIRKLVRALEDASEFLTKTQANT